VIGESACPLHHPALAARATGGPPPPLRCATRWRITDTVIARSVATKQSRLGAAQLDCFADARNDEHHYSRDAIAPEFCQRHSKNCLAEHDPVRLGRRWDRLSSRSGSANKKEAERRQAHILLVRISGCGSREASRARLSAFHHGSCQGLHLLTQLQARLPGTRFGRALPAVSCPSPVAAPHAPAVVPESMMPKAARVRSANPPAGTALAPSSGLPPEGVRR
jgi:hypothetical protein